jgi:hypothetical protein
MKKFLAIVAIAAAFTACNEEKKAEGATDAPAVDTANKATGDTANKATADTTGKVGGVSNVIEAGKDAVKTGVEAGKDAVKTGVEAGKEAVKTGVEAGKDAMKAATPEVKK